MKTDKTSTTRICPRCGKSYNEHPALSRKDNKTLLCSDCGVRESLETIGVLEKEQEEIIGIIHRANGGEYCE